MNNLKEELLKHKYMNNENCDTINEVDLLKEEVKRLNDENQKLKVFVLQLSRSLQNVTEYLSRFHNQSWAAYLYSIGDRGKI